MSLVLPPETLDYVIDFLYNDKKALSACSLASPLLTPAARHHVFSELALAPAEINSFLELLDAPWCTIPAAIQSIAIEQRRCRRRRGKADQGFYVPSNFPQMVRRLGGIRSLRFEDVDLSEISPPLMYGLFQANKVEKAVLRNTTVYNMEPLLRYLTSLPHLRELSISHLEAEETMSSEEEFRGGMKAFRMPLLDGGSSSTELLYWLRLQSFIPTVDIFQIDLAASSSAPALLEEYAKYLGHSVDEIHVKWPTAQSDPTHMDYAHFTNLKAIRLQVGLRLGYTSDLVLAERTLRAIAEQVDSPYFSKVTLEVNILPVQFALSFLGIEEHQAFKGFKWDGIIDFLQEREINEFNLIIRGLPKCQRTPVEDYLKSDPFASLYKAGHMHVACYM